MSNKENILLLTDVPPCENYSGGAFLNQLSEILIEEKINLFGYFMPPSGLNIIFNQYVKNKINFKVINYTNDQYYDEYSKENYLEELNAEVDACVDFIKQNNIKRIWCYVQCENILRLLYGVFEKTKLPYVVQIMDPIEWHIKARAFTENRKKDVLNLFNIVINNASYCLTASENMNLIYKSKFKTPCEYITVSHKPNKQNNRIIEKDIPYTITLAGQIYCIDEMTRFLQALDKLEWKFEGNNIVLKYFGSFWLKKYVEDNNIISKDNLEMIIEMGYYPQDKLYEELNKSHLLYCPYFFSDDEVLRKVAEESFPSKLISYLNTNTNVLVHGPSYSSPVKFIRKNECAFVIDSDVVNDIAKQLKKIIKDTPSKKYIENAKITFENNFTRDVIKKKFLNALTLENYNNDGMVILEVNNVDVYGSRFNGYDRIKPINKYTKHNLNQIVTYKLSNNKNVYKYYENNRIEQLEINYRQFENEILSVHSQFSIIGELLLNSDVFKKSNIIHYHLIHNTKLPLPMLTHLFKIKPTVITIHDPWNFTGRCVYPCQCEEWKNGCKKCDNLDSLFPFKLDNCKYLWNQKEKIAKGWDIDIVIATNYLNETFVKKSPITKHFKNIHVLPFGVDLDLFKDNSNKYEMRKKLNIPEDDIVIFLRSQIACKCAKEIREALETLETDKSVTILTCSEIGNFNNLKNKYNIIELGNIVDNEIVEAFNACDFFLMPTKGETFGVMAIEAMACARTVVVFDNMTLPQITFAPECGVLVEDQNVEKLAEAIKFLIDNEDERIRRGKLGRELAEKHYDVKNFNENMIKIYEQAFERQKYKLNSFHSAIDFHYDASNLNVRKLIYAINKNYKLIFANEQIKFNFDVNYIDKEFNSSVYTTIDYSDDEVVKFLNYFNNMVYLHYKDIAYYTYSSVYAKDGTVMLVNNNNQAEGKSKLYKLYYYLRYDRYRLKESVKFRLANKPQIYTFAKKTYVCVRKIKNKF